MASSTQKTFTVFYKMFSFSVSYKKTFVQAVNKTQAYEKAINNVIPNQENGNFPYQLYIK